MTAPTRTLGRAQVARLRFACRWGDNAVADLVAVQKLGGRFEERAAVARIERSGSALDDGKLIIGERERLRRNGLPC
jgi:hypothetical protein